MKKRNLAIIFCIIALGILSYFGLKPILSYDVLLNVPSDISDFNINLFYSDITMNATQGFKISKKTVSRLKADFKSYTEGFLPSVQYNTILSAINTFRKQLGESPLTYFHDYYEDKSLMIVSFTGGLENIYIIDKKSLKVRRLQYAKPDNLGNMYVSHLRRIDDTFVLLGGEVNSYHAFVYEIDADTFMVKSAVRLSTHPTAIREEHYTLDALGNAIFIGGNKLQVFSYKTHNFFDIPLNFNAHYVLSDKDKRIVLSLNIDSIHYALLDNSLRLSQIGNLSLPSTNTTLVKAFLKDNYLYLISYDNMNKLYKNHITCYNLLTNKMTYCLGLHQYGKRALLDGTLNLSFDSIEN